MITIQLGSWLFRVDPTGDVRVTTLSGRPLDAWAYAALTEYFADELAAELQAQRDEETARRTIWSEEGRER